VHTWDSFAMALGGPLLAVDLTGHGQLQMASGPELPSRGQCGNSGLRVRHGESRLRCQFVVYVLRWWARGRPWPGRSLVEGSSGSYAGRAMHWAGLWRPRPAASTGVDQGHAPGRKIWV